MVPSRNIRATLGTGRKEVTQQEAEVTSTINSCLRARSQDIAPIRWESAFREQLCL